MQKRFVYLNGNVLAAEHACISPFDIGLLRGYAVFDLLRTIDGRPFLLAEHLKRLRASAASLNLAVPASDEEITSAIHELLERNDHAEATIRMVLTGGESADGMSFDSATPTFYIITHELPVPPPELYERGGRILTHHHRREIPEAKTTNYLTMLRNRDRLTRNGAMDLLYHDDSQVYEAASASVYAVRDNTIYAPDRDVLWGTIGSLILEIAQQEFSVVHRTMSLEDFLSADEVFLTSTTRGVVPIVTIDDRAIGNGMVGPITRALMKRFGEVTTGD